jgi:hypothetical protein
MKQSIIIAVLLLLKVVLLTGLFFINSVLGVIEAIFIKELPLVSPTVTKLNKALYCCR